MTSKNELEGRKCLNVLWDYDGTLFNTYPAFTEVMYELMNKKVAKEAIYKELKISFSHAVEFFGLDEEQVKQFKERERALSPKEKGPFPYVEEVLQKTNVNVIMTHKSRNEVMAILDYYDWHKYFSEIVAGDDGFPRKPDSASYRYLHKRHHLDLAVGDRLLDIIPAKEIGLSTCLFQNEAKGADYYLQSYQDFFAVIK